MFTKVTKNINVKTNTSKLILFFTDITNDKNTSEPTSTWGRIYFELYTVPRTAGTIYISTHIRKDIQQQNARQNLFLN